jgi:SAM-dependent methyltransferase
MAHSQATNEHILNRADMINMIAKKIGAKTYLEIGVQTGKTFRAVNVEDKIGVDPDPQWKDQTHIMGSDQFFEQLEDDEKFDIIFVDGLHQWEQVARDLANSVEHLAPGGVILVDDCAPRQKAYQTRQPTAVHWTGDVWRAWLRYRSKMAKRGWFSCTYDVAFGLGILHQHKDAVELSDDVETMCEHSWKLPYSQFAEHFDRVLDFQSVQSFQDDWSE